MIDFESVMEGLAGQKEKSLPTSLRDEAAKSKVKQYLDMAQNIAKESGIDIESMFDEMMGEGSDAEQESPAEDKAEGGVEEPQDERGMSDETDSDNIPGKNEAYASSPDAKKAKMKAALLVIKKKMGK